MCIVWSRVLWNARGVLNLLLHLLEYFSGSPELINNSTRYSHFLLWGGINLTHYAFKRSREESLVLNVNTGDDCCIPILSWCIVRSPKCKANQTSFFHHLIQRPDRLLVLTASVLAATPLPRFTTLILNSQLQ